MDEDTITLLAKILADQKEKVKRALEVPRKLKPFQNMLASLLRREGFDYPIRYWGNKRLF